MTQPLFKIEIFLEYWFVLWEEMFRPTDVLQRGALKQVCLLYFAVLFFFNVDYIIYGDTRLWRSFPSPILHGYGSGHYKSLE